MEKIAIPIWDARVSPVLDTATRLMILEFDNGNEVEREVLNIPQAHFMVRAKYIAELKVNTILCGALSRPLRRTLTQRGINVFPWVTGEVKDVVQAYLQNNLSNERFMLPGRHRRNRKHGCRCKDCNYPTDISGSDFYQEEK